jgi:membrane-associated protease RseP (regulator of RpoE activity)
MWPSSTSPDTARRAHAFMNAPRAGTTYALIAGLIVSAGVVTWFVLPVYERPAAGGAGATTSGPAIVVPPVATRTTPAAASAPAPMSPKAASARGAGVDTIELDQRQVAKVTRGLTANPGGGILVESMPPGSVASQLRVQAGDVIVSVNGHAVTSPEEFARIYREQGLPRQMTVIHNGREMHRH